jgi:hypothetical protein
VCHAPLQAQVAIHLVVGELMLFIHPMWDHESQRIGKQKCTPVGYALHVLADYTGFLGLLLLFGMPALLVWQWMFSTFYWSLLWLLVVPFGVGIVSEVLYHYSWWLVLRQTLIDG